MMATKKNSTRKATSSMDSPKTTPCGLPYVRIVQNFRLIWLDGSINEVDNNDCRKTITKLRQVVNSVNTFMDADECIDFINSIQEEKVFIICSGTFSQTIIPIVHDKSKVNTIYIFCENKAWHKKWVQQWPKVKGVFTDITPICEELKQAVQDCDQNMVSISFVQSSDGASNENLDQLDRSFMYTQILKEILLYINFDQKHIQEFSMYCAEQLAGNSAELKNVEKLRKEYHDHQPIWWYTYDCFLYSMLNRALRMMEVDLIIKMGFFIRDLHNHIAALHSEQFDGQNDSNSFAVYRGQGLTQADFDQLTKTKGGLLSFNNFLSTSKNRNVSLEFARQTMTTSSLVGVLFIMIIDPSMSATHFANVNDISYFKEEEEILFSMHSVFRIESMKQLDKSNRLWQVDLTLTSDNDPELYALTELMRKETYPHLKAWDRLGMLLIKLGHFNKAQELYDVLLKQTTDTKEIAHLYHMLGIIKDDQGEYADAIIFYEKSIKINQEILSPTHLDLTASYNNIGKVYRKMKDYPQALSYFEKALEIRREVLPSNHPDLAVSYNNIGLVHSNMGEYSKALLYYKKDLEISQKTLPPNHPNLAISYNNIGGVYSSMGEYSNALSYYEKDLEISQKTLPPNHPDLVFCYNNIGSTYESMGEYSKAASFYKRGVDIGQRSLPANHPNLLNLRMNIERVEKKL
jgi:tetratricopeptide (TPR) repeat protein